MNIAKNRFYADPANGGLGLFNPEEFFTALKCTWIKRTHSLCHDNWRRLILNAAQNNNVCIIQEDDTENMGTLCKGIVKSFIKVRNAFGTLDNNFATVPIFNNSFFSFKLRGETFDFDNNFFLEHLPGLSEIKKTVPLLE
jgi:hypothetical protein